MTAPQKKATVADQEVGAAPVGTDGDPEPKPKPTKVKAPTMMSKAKKNSYAPEEDTLLLALVAEHGRAEGVRQFVQQNGHRTQYGAECRLHRLTKKAAE